MTAIRLPVSFVLSLLATATLFWILGVLVAVDPNGLTGHVRAIPHIDFRPHVPETPEAHIIRVPPPIKRPMLADVSPVVIDRVNVVRPGNDPSELAPPEIFGGEGELGVPPGDGRGLALRSGSDRAPVPQVRVEPDYPPQARDRGIEGWITFRFTVTAEGRVKDIQILDAQPARIWDTATTRAVANWRYQPAMKDGRPVEQRGVTVTYRYELER